jgi:hypothetical protein
VIVTTGITGRYATDSFLTGGETGMTSKNTLRSEMDKCLKDIDPEKIGDLGFIVVVGRTDDGIAWHSHYTDIGVCPHCLANAMKSIADGLMEDGDRMTDDAIDRWWNESDHDSRREIFEFMEGVDDYSEEKYTNEVKRG